MKRTLLLFLFVNFLLGTKAQNSNRQINFKTIDRDSISLPLNEDYYLIEDSCAQIIRYCRFDFYKRKYYGNFTDVSKTDPKLVVAAGNYSSDGLKNGFFTTRYLNGVLMANGNFKDDQYDGKWEMFYDNGKPEIKFEVINGVFSVTDEWNADGKKVVDNGNGDYTGNFGGLYWKGRLLNGKPDGKWELVMPVIRLFQLSILKKDSSKMGQWEPGITLQQNSYWLVLLNYRLLKQKVWFFPISRVMVKNANE